MGNAFQLLTCLVTVLGQAQFEGPHPQASGLSRSGLGLLPCWGPLLEQRVSLLWSCLRGQPQAPVFAHRGISPPANLGTCGKLGLLSLTSGSRAARGDRQLSVGPGAGGCLHKPAFQRAASLESDMSHQGFEAAGAILPREDRPKRTMAVTEGTGCKPGRRSEARTEVSQATAGVSEPFSVPCKMPAKQSCTEHRPCPPAAWDTVRADGCGDTP